MDPIDDIRMRLAENKIERREVNFRYLTQGQQVIVLELLINKLGFEIHGDEGLGLIYSKLSLEKTVRTHRP